MSHDDSILKKLKIKITLLQHAAPQSSIFISAHNIKIILFSLQIINCYI